MRGGQKHRAKVFNDITHLEVYTMPDKKDIKERLILAALELFSEQGIHGVSMRNINTLSGTKNSGAAHYHFGNKLGLIKALLEFLSNTVQEIRDEHFQEAQVQIATGQADARTILGAFYTPYIHLHEEREYGKQAIRFFARLATEATPEIQGVLNEQFGARFELLFNLLSKMLPQTDANVLKRQILFSWISAIHSLADLDYLSNTFYGDMSGDSHEQIVEQFIDYVLYGMTYNP